VEAGTHPPVLSITLAVRIYSPRRLAA
jgi:hypothetical protein